MMLMVLVFFLATDMKIKVLGELDFVSCFFIAKPIIPLTSHQKKQNVKPGWPFSCHHLKRTKPKTLLKQGKHYTGFNEPS